MKYVVTEGPYNPLNKSLPIEFAAAAVRVARMLGHLLYGALLAGAYPLLKHRARQSIMQRWSCALLDMLRVRLEIVGQVPDYHERGMVLVANRVSRLDVLLLNAVRPACFIARSEVRCWPLLGMLYWLARTIFIMPNIRRDIMRTRSRIAAMLKQGESVVMFPESVPGGGSKVRPFRPLLFRCATDAGASLCPVAIYYHDTAGQHSNHTFLAAGIAFLHSIRTILRGGSVHATLVFLPQVCSIGKTRSALAVETYGAISAALDRICRAEDVARAKPSASEAPSSPVPPYQPIYSLLLDPALRNIRERHGNR